MTFTSSTAAAPAASASATAALPRRPALQHPTSALESRLECPNLVRATRANIAGIFGTHGGAPARGVHDHGGDCRRTRAAVAPQCVLAKHSRGDLELEPSVRYLGLYGQEGGGHAGASACQAAPIPRGRSGGASHNGR